MLRITGFEEQTQIRYSESEAVIKYRVDKMFIVTFTLG